MVANAAVVARGEDGTSGAPCTSRHGSAVPLAHIGGGGGGHAPHRGQRAGVQQRQTGGPRALAPPAQPARHTHRSQNTLYCVSVVYWVRPNATVRHTAGPRRRGQGVACPHPALPRCNQGHPGRSPHLGTLTMRRCSRSVAALVRRPWLVRVRSTFEGAPPGLQLRDADPVLGRRTAPTVRARGPPRAPRMHLDSCYMAKAGGAVHHGTLPHHGPRNRQTARWQALQTRTAPEVHLARTNLPVMVCPLGA